MAVIGKGPTSYEARTTRSGDQPEFPCVPRAGQLPFAWSGSTHGPKGWRMARWSPIDDMWRSRPKSSKVVVYYDNPIFRSTRPRREIQPIHNDFRSMFMAPDVFGNRVIGNERKRMWIPPSRPAQPFGPIGQFGDVIDFGPHMPGPSDLPPFHGGPFATPLPGGCPGLSAGLFETYPNFMSASRSGVIGAGRGSFMDLIPNPMTGGADAFGFWLQWGAANNNCLWWILSDGHLPSNDEFKAPGVFSLQELYHRLKECRPPAIRGHYPCLYPDIPRDPSSLGLDFVFTDDNPTCPGVTEEVWETVVSAAFQVLKQNTDIIRWLGCVLDPRLGDCLEQVLSGGVEFTVEIRDPVSRGEPDYGLAFTSSGSSDTVCHFKINGPSTCYGRDLIPGPDATGDAAKTRDCSIANSASYMLHELVHYCAWRDGVDYDVPGSGQDAAEDCSLAWMMASAFQWAMGWRYPWLLDSGGCDKWQSPGKLFGDP